MKFSRNTALRWYTKDTINDFTSNGVPHEVCVNEISDLAFLRLKRYLIMNCEHTLDDETSINYRISLAYTAKRLKFQNMARSHAK